MSDWAWRLISSRTFKAEILLNLPPSPCFSAVFSLLWGNSTHDSAINGLKSQRTGGSSATGTAGGHRTRATPGHEDADLCAAQIAKLSGSVHLLFPPLSSPFCLSTSSGCPPANRCHSARLSAITSLPLYLSTSRQETTSGSRDKRRLVVNKGARWIVDVTRYHVIEVLLSFYVIFFF